MDPVSLLENWLAPITDPLKEFRSQIQEISNIHQNAVNTFQNQVNTLTDTSSPEAMTGPGADSISLVAENYTSTELTVSDIEGPISSISNASGLCETAVSDILEAVSGAGFAAADTEVLGEVTAVVDVSAVAQGGLDIPDDVVAGALTSVTIESVVTGLIMLATIIAGIIWVWRGAMDALSGSFQHAQLPEKPQPISPQKIDLNQVRTIAGQLRAEGYTVDDAEVEALLRAGYDPETIKNILREGLYGLFNPPQTPQTQVTTAQLMNELLPSDQFKFIQLVKQYQKTHPNITSDQVLNYLRYTKMKAQLDYLTAQITGTDPDDPISHAIVNEFPQRAADMERRLDQKIGNSINGVIDPFTVTDDKLDGWEPHITGIWGEWGVIKNYYQQGKLVDYSIDLQPRGSGEVDVKINENHIEKWVEVKNVKNTDKAWGTALKQVKKYITIDHAKNVIIELPQQDPNNPRNWVSAQQLKNLAETEKAYPGVQFELRGMQTQQLPFEPPIGYWGNIIP